MIERFNFYDVYGYLLPGGFLLVVLWLPFGLALKMWPPADFGSAVVGLGVAYIAGHVLYNLSEAMFPHRMRDPEHERPAPAQPLNGWQRVRKWLRTPLKGVLAATIRFVGGDSSSQVRRAPSDLLFDTTSKDSWRCSGLYLSDEMKSKLTSKIKEQFGDTIEANAPNKWTKELGRVRDEACLKCRSFLIQKKAAAYAEQQQSMYALLRGVGGVFALAGSLYLGLCIGRLLRGGVADFNLISLTVFALWIRIALFFILGAGAFMFFSCLAMSGSSPSSLNAPARRCAFMLSAAMLGCVGAIFAYSATAKPLLKLGLRAEYYEAAALFAATMVAFGLSRLCIVGFRYFAASFANVVYRDFVAHAKESNGDGGLRL